MPKLSEYITALESNGALHHGALLSDEYKKIVLSAFVNTNETKISKKDFKENGAQYSLIRDEQGKIFAIYNPGKKEGIANGAFGIIKIAQNIETNEWCLVKIQKIKKQGNSLPGFIDKIHAEKKFVNKAQILHGYQQRMNAEKNTFVSYIFMAEVPGVAVIDAIHPERGFVKSQGENLTDLQRLIILKNALTRLNELRQNNIIHRDLSPQNIFIDEDLQVHFIDWGAAVESDMQGFCNDFPPQLGALRRKIRYANGYDFITLLDTLSELNVLDNSEVRAAMLKIRNQCGDNKKGYNNIDLTSLINSTQNLIDQHFSKQQKMSI